MHRLWEAPHHVRWQVDMGQDEIKSSDILLTYHQGLGFWVLGLGVMG